VRRSELIRKIRQEARRQGVEWKQVEGAKHDTFWLGLVKIPIPRHAEIGQRTPRTSCTSAKPSWGRAGGGTEDLSR
jgi:hypothetical protein